MIKEYIKNQDKLDGHYQKDAINFAIEGNEKFFIKSHTEPLMSENIVKGVLDLYLSLKDQLEPGDKVIVKVDENGNVIGYRIVRGGGSGTNCSDRAGRGSGGPNSNQNNPADASLGGGGGGIGKDEKNIFGDKTSPRTKKPEMMERTFDEELEKILIH